MTQHPTQVSSIDILKISSYQRSYIEELETNHVRHRLLYLRAWAMLNSAIHTSGCVGRGGFLEARIENLLVCISLGELAVFRYQQMRNNTCLK